MMWSWFSLFRLFLFTPLSATHGQVATFNRKSMETSVFGFHVQNAPIPTWLHRFLPPINYLCQVLSAFTYAFIISYIEPQFLNGLLLSWFFLMPFYLILWTLSKWRGGGGVADAQTVRSVRAWWCVEFNDITVTEWPGRVPGREVCVLICVCLRAAECETSSSQPRRL